MWTPYCHVICKYFLTVGKLSFRFVDGFLCCAKAFKFNKAPFVYFCFCFLCLGGQIPKNDAMIYVRVFYLCFLILLLSVYAKKMKKLIWKYTCIPVFLCLVALSIVPDSFVTLWIIACQAPPSMEFSRQEYWSGLSFPLPGDVPDPGDETQVSCIGRQLLYHWAKPGKPQSLWRHL